MSTRTVVFSTILWALCSLACAGQSAEEQDKSRPNIIFFLTDDQRFDFLGCSGHPIVKTPTIDKLAKEGTRFENMFVTTATCWISRVSILSGMYMRQHRFVGGTVSSEVAKVIYPRLLKESGYKTAYIGKTHFKLPKADHDKTFDYFHHIGRNPYFKKQADGTLRHESELCGDHAIKFIDQQDKKTPFFISVNFNATHAEDRDKKDHYPYPKAVAKLYTGMKMPTPRLNSPEIIAAQPEFLRRSMHYDRFKWRWDTPEKYQHNMRNYLRMASGIDGVMARVLEHLKKKGFDKNTVIVYSADNGYYAGNRGFAGKWTHYDESLRVPLIIFNPRQKKHRGQVASQMALNIDIGSTILDYAGVARPKNYNGTSLKKIVQGETPKNWRRETLGEIHTKHKSIPSWSGIRAERYVYVHYSDNDYEFLHDLEIDPDQVKNYAKDKKYKKILEEFRKKLKDTLKPLGGPFNIKKKK
jgi:arylsulfatase A-like enzyme